MEHRKNERTCRQKRLISPDINPILTKYLYQQNRSSLSLLTQFITGHNYLCYHLAVAGQQSDPPPLCSWLCQAAKKDSWQLLTTCDYLAIKRHCLFPFYLFCQIADPFALLTFIKTSKIITLSTRTFQVPLS